MHGNLLPGITAAALSFTALTIAFFVLAESKPPDAAIRSGVPPQFDPVVWRSLMHRKMLLAIIGALFLTILAVSGMETSVTLHARDRFGFRQLDLAYFFLFMGLIVAAIQGGLIGRLAKAFGERTLVMIGTASFTIGLVLVPVVFRVPLLYSVAFFIAVGQGLTYPSLTSLVTKVSDASEQGSMLGLASGIGSLARFLGPIVSGFFYDLARARGAFFAGASMTLVAFLISMWMWRVEWQS
jgi:MFS family permease